jgi:hypothetical protein
MANLSWNEIQAAAITFSRRWESETSESAEKQTFWNEFFAVFGRERRVVASFEAPVRNLYQRFNHIDLLWRGVVLVEHKSTGRSMEAAELQAFDYIQDLAREQRFDEIPRYIIVSDFARIALYDLEPADQRELPLFAGLRYEQIEFPLRELYRNVRQFAFIKGERRVRLDPQDPANQKAYDRMCQLHDELKTGGLTGPDLERLLVRILFCLFAEDTEIFDPNGFQGFIRNHTRSNGSDLGARLNELFEVLNTPIERRHRNLQEDLAAFPYVNGSLFAERLTIPSFTSSQRQALLEATEFQWARISPAVFGSLFQGVMLPQERRQQGAHYTSERDIMKVIRSLFLDDLRADFDRLRADRSTRRRSALEAFNIRLRDMRFLDPACGCGNFLVLAYRELRLIELEVLRELNASGIQTAALSVLILVDVDQFFGIEFAEWPTRIAEVAMWLMDHQMNQLVTETLGQTYARLPLRHSPHIVQANALRIEWRTVLPAEQCTYILGNPPFVGKHLMTTDQGQDMEIVWAGLKGRGFLDYVTGWYRKAVDYIANTQIRVAFVSTNSITQGEQVGILWNELFQRWHIKIHFAHRTFSWKSEARGGAHVHCVIIGFAAFDASQKQLYDYDADKEHAVVSQVRNISPYLVEGQDIALPIRSRPVCEVPQIVNGNKPADGGFLIVEEHDREAFLTANPIVRPFLRRFISAEEYLNGEMRWVLWLVDAPPSLIRNNPGVRERVNGVRMFRLASRKESTRRRAERPALFDQIRQPTSEYIVIPRHSSERRKYIPYGYFSPEVIIGDSCTAISEASPYHFGVISSLMHMAWMRTVCGRLKSDLRYSNKLVYNNFPWPEVDERLRASVENAGRAVLAARAQ